MNTEDLAAEYLARTEGGEKVDREEFLARLGTTLARAEFESLLLGAGRAVRGLPRALARDTVLRGRYRILEEIGSGGMGRVFSAHDLQLQRKVAVKVLAALDQGNAEREEMFLKESRLLAALQHPNIVAVHEAGRDSELTFIVMDLVDGIALSDVIESARKELETTNGRKLSPREGALLERAIGKKLPDGRSNLIQPRDWYGSVARIMHELARTLEAAHGQRVIHRDLKPSNVLLLGGGSPVVLDFGLAGSLDLRAGAVTQRLYGSVAYLAPEQARTQQVGTDPRTDVYQLGLILYELLTLRRAFPGHDIGDVLQRIKDGFFDAPRKRNPAVPRELEAICMMALELSPERRYQSAKALREDLDRYMEGLVPIASRSSRWRATVRTSRYYAKKHPVVVGISGMLAAGLAVFLTVPMGTPRAVLNPWLLPRGAESTIAIKTGDNIRGGDSLCVTVNSPEPQFVYAVSLFKKKDDPRRYFAPMTPYFLADIVARQRKGTALPETGKKGLEVPGCPDNTSCPTIVCTTAEEANEVEGLLVVSSHEPRPEVEEWLKRLGGRPQGMPEEEAWEAFSKSSQTRGGDISKIPQAKFDEAFKNVKLVVESPKQNQNLSGLNTLKVECRVEQAAK